MSHLIATSEAMQTLLSPADIASNNATANAVKLFDQLTGASYYGFHFREVLRTDPDARAAAAQLVACLKAADVQGIN